MRTGRSARENRRIFGFYGNNVDARAAGFEDLADARDGAACADARDKNVDLTVEIIPDFLSRCAAVNIGIGGVFELLRNDGIRNGSL